MGGGEDENCNEGRTRKREEERMKTATKEGRGKERERRRGGKEKGKGRRGCDRERGTRMKTAAEGAIGRTHKDLIREASSTRTTTAAEEQRARD